MRRNTASRRAWLRLSIAAAALGVVPDSASAHVKWFCTIVDVASPPAALAQVLSPIFLLCAAGFAFLILVGSYADGWIALLRPGWLSCGERLRGPEELVVRVAIGSYCLFLWDRAAVVPWGHAGSILTPETLDHDRLIGALQVAVAALVLRRDSCALAAVGLAALYGVGVARYGVFPMTDYVYFLGFAAYLALTPRWAGRWRGWRMPLLGGSLGFSLMWTAVEKFLYPQWTAQVLVEHPHLTAGFPVSSVVVIAGFVEFSLAFYLVVGRGLLRVGALALVAVFVSAIPEFGELDSVGHLPIVAILLAMCLRGATPLQEARLLPARGPAVNAAVVAGLFVLALAVMTGLYYGLQMSAVPV